MVTNAKDRLRLGNIMPFSKPVYIKANKSGVLRSAKKKAFEKLKSCALCPRECRVNRLSGDTGVCSTGISALVSSFNPHFGEEAPLSGSKGSGTIFFTHCNLMCSFCQNYEISHQGQGDLISDTQLAEIMLVLQKSGCHNINFVTPSHVVPQILSALEMAVEKGLSLPLVYNSGGYDSIETLKLLEGIFDIYMPDFKFWNPDIADKTCNAPDYPEIARKAVVEMYRQVGDLVMDEDGIARRGVLLRHLVLPGGLAGTREIMKFIVEKVSPDTYVNIMPQYRPCGRAHEIPEISKGLMPDDYKMALQDAIEAGITRLDNRKAVFLFR